VPIGVTIPCPGEEGIWREREGLSRRLSLTPGIHGAWHCDMAPGSSVLEPDRRVNLVGMGGYSRTRWKILHCFASMGPLKRCLAAASVLVLHLYPV
jgi:hypothetical protein